MKQYLGIKSQHRDAILFYRMGDFYEMFFEDAVIAAPVLGIALTKRGKQDSQDIPMCGIPFHSCDSYIYKLIEAGYKLAICEQLESPEEAKKRGEESIKFTQCAGDGHTVKHDKHTRAAAALLVMTSVNMAVVMYTPKITPKVPAQLVAPKIAPAMACAAPVLSSAVARPNDAAIVTSNEMGIAAVACCKVRQPVTSKAMAVTLEQIRK